jgi:hypothetical protein
MDNTMFNAIHKVSSKKTSIAGLVIAACMAALLCAGTATAGDDSLASGTPEQIASLNAVMEQVFRDIPPAGQKVSQTLLDKVQDGVRVPVIVRLREGALPYGIFADKKRLRSTMINRLQDTVVDDVAALSAFIHARLESVCSLIGKILKTASPGKRKTSP